MAKFLWKNVADDCFGPDMNDLYIDGELIAKVTGKFTEHFVSILYKNLPGSSTPNWVKARVTVPMNQDILQAVEHFLVHGQWPAYAQDHWFEDDILRRGNEAAVEQDDVFRGDEIIF